MPEIKADELIREMQGDLNLLCFVCKTRMKEQSKVRVCGECRAPKSIRKAYEYLAERKDDKPKVICICGSTRFADQHAIMRWEFEKLGHICLMINYLPHWYADSQGWNGNDHFAEQSGLKKPLDKLHLRKIDMSDEVFIVNVDGYIGESTQDEIEYAESQGKFVQYLEGKR